MKPLRSLYFPALCAAVLLPTLACGVLTPWKTASAIAGLLELLLLIAVHRMLFKPLRVIEAGMDLLREQDFSSRLRKVGQPDADKVAGMFNYMMDRLRLQNLLIREQHEFLDLLIDASPMGVIILDDEEQITHLNDAARTMLGVDWPRSFLSLDTPLGAALAQLEQGQVRTLRLSNNEVFRCSRLHFMDRGWQHPFILIDRLTDEVRTAEKQVFTRVIRTMAHEVNNSMAAIMSTLSTVRSIVADTPAAGQLSGPIDACLTRSGELTGFVRRFAEVVKVPEPRLCLTDFMELINSARPILESLCSACGARLITDLDGDVAPLKMDPVLMQQALVNIVKNAAESAAQGGTVTLRASGRTLLVTDNGPGLAPDAADHLFSALYTTKPDGQGLGLLLVAEILNKHSARFSLSTTPPLTTFAITL